MGRKIVMLTTAAGPGGSFDSGRTYENVDDALAAELVAGGAARDVTEDAPAPDAPAEDVAAEDAPARRTRRPTDDGTPVVA